MAPQYLHAIKVEINHESMIFGHAGVMVLVNHSYSLVMLELRPSIGLSGRRDLVG